MYLEDDIRIAFKIQTGIIFTGRLSEIIRANLQKSA